MFPAALRLLITVVAMAIAVEGGYRLYLFFKYPEHFKSATAIDAAEFSVWSASLGQYDRVYGYGYVPALKVNNVQLAGGIVRGCGQFAVANEQGNLGPSVPDFDEADVRIVVFGDSFAGAYATGP